MYFNTTEFLHFSLTLFFWFAWRLSCFLSSYPLLPNAYVHTYSFCYHFKVRLGLMGGISSSSFFWSTWFHVNLRLTPLKRWSIGVDFLLFLMFVCFDLHKTSTHVLGRTLFVTPALQLRSLLLLIKNLCSGPSGSWAIHWLINNGSVCLLFGVLDTPLLFPSGPIVMNCATWSLIVSCMDLVPWPYWLDSLCIRSDLDLYLYLYLSAFHHTFDIVKWTLEIGPGWMMVISWSDRSGDFTMKRSGHSAEQIICKLKTGKQLIAQDKIVVDCRVMEVTQPTYDRSRHEYGGI